MIYMAFERGGPKLSNTTTRALAQRTAVQQRQLRFFALKKYCAAW